MDEFHSNQNFSSSSLVKPATFMEQDQFLNIPFSTPNENLVQFSNTSPEGDSYEESDHFSDFAFTYISQMLMDEEDKVVDFHEYSALEATEKPFYEILGEKYPPFSFNSESTDIISPQSGSLSSANGGGGDGSGNGIVENSWLYDYPEFQLPIEFATQSSFGSTNTISDNLEGFGLGSDGVSDLFLESTPNWHFNKGSVEEARKFLPSYDKLIIDLEPNGVSLPLERKEENRFVEIKSEKEEREHDNSFLGSRGRKKPHSDYLNYDVERSVKQLAVSYEGNERTEMFDDVLLCNGGIFPKAVNDLREALQHVASKNSHSGHSKGSNGGQGRGKKQPNKEVDLQTLLIQCAQMVSADDQRSTNEMLKHIRQHSSPAGDGSQRLAHYFANGIEARLAGTGSDIYNSFSQQRRTATDFVKALQLYLAASPFKKISFFFANQTILDASKKATRIHIIDFGIHFGFQWPSLLQSISARPGVPPKVRITGIDLPQPGLRPAERIEETGRRLADYARSFNLPFEYKAIASKWEDVCVEDLDIDGDEVLVVNCMYQLKYLADETVVEDSPRNTVLNTIRQMNPDVFIHGIVNGSYNAPFFVTRFREAWYHFSALFDMLETIVPREDEQRLLLEREIFGREAINVIACEGLERVERPETYKQWQLRNQRAGFMQNPLNDEILKKARAKVKNFYHKDFVVDEYGRWLVQGWKGRIILALSSWKPDNSS